MRAAKLKFHNILGFEDYEVSLGAINRITGENGTGKTSLLQGFIGLFGPGHDASLLRAGAEQGEAVLVIEEDNGSTTTVSKQISSDQTKPKVNNSKLGPLAPARYLKHVADLLALNPVEFLNLRDKKKRIEWLLTFCPMELDQQALVEAVGDWAIPPDWCEGPALDVIARVRKAIYDQRTGINRSAEDKARTVRELSATLPDDDGANHSAELTNLRNRQAQTARKLAAVEQKSAEILSGEQQRIQSEHAVKRAKLEAEVQTKIDEIKRQLAADVDSLVALKDSELEQLRQDALQKTAEAAQPLLTEQTDLIAKIAAAEERAKAQATAASVRSMVDRTQKEADQLAAQSQKLTGSLDRLDALKLDLLDQLPVKGMAIQDGEIYIDGVPFDRVNTARKVAIALRIACMRAESLDCKMICLDDAEHLDARNFKALEHACGQLVQDGYQFLIGRVSDPPAGWPADKPFFEVQTEAQL